MCVVILSFRRWKPEGYELLEIMSVAGGGIMLYKVKFKINLKNESGMLNVVLVVEYMLQLLFAIKAVKMLKYPVD